MSLTKVSYSMITGAPVNVMDFGAVGDGIADDTAAVQAAFDYAITNNAPLVAANTFLINGKISINKTSEDRTPTYIFGGGTFKKTNAGVMFDALNNATSEIFFNNIYFLASSAVNVIAFECNQELIRSYFYNCSFESFDVCFDSTGYLMQSFRINGCDFSGIKSWVINCGTTGGYPVGSAFDVQITQCQIEGQTGGVFRGSTGSFNVNQCVIENISSQPAFYITNSGSTNISNNYFENCYQGVIVCAPLSNCAGIVAQSNYVGLNAGTDFIVWGETLTACVTISNVVNGGQTNDTTQTTSGFVQTLNDVNIGNVPDGSLAYKTPYQISGTFVPVVQGTTTAGTAIYADQTGDYTKIGNVVSFSLSVSWSSHTGTGTIVIAGFPALPKNAYIPVSAIPINFAVSANQVLSAAFLDGVAHVFPVAITSNGGSGYSTLSIASYATGNLTIAGSYLTP